MNRDSMNDRASAALGPQTRELTEAELDAVSGGIVMLENPTAMVSSYQSGGPHAATAVIAII
jgi:hypothetical protein